MARKQHQEEGGKGVANPPDEIQRAFWQYRRVWLAIIALLIAARFILPHVHKMMKGWETKFCGAAIELGKSEAPADALKVSNVEAANAIFKPKIEVPPALADLDGPLLVQAWKCSPLGEEGACLRYLWQGETLTLVSTPKAHKGAKPSGFFIRTGWSAYFIVEKGIATALVGPFTPDQLSSVWPYAVKFANATAH